MIEDTPMIGSESERVHTNFGRFRIVKELGRGGFGVVFLAIDADLNLSPALKLPLAEPLLDADVRLRFLREAKASAVLDHPNLVPLYEAGEIDSICYLASAYCEGPTLGSVARPATIGRASRSRGSAPVADMAIAVQHSHERGVLHRDLKPSNIMIEQGEAASSNCNRGSPISACAWLADQPGEEATASFAAMGSAPYMAPEQAEGKKVAAGPPTSIAWGPSFTRCSAVAHLIAGPIELDTLRLVINTKPAAPRGRRPEIPRDLEAICLKCLEKNPSLVTPRRRTLRTTCTGFWMGGRPWRGPPRRLIALRGGFDGIRRSSSFRFSPLRSPGCSWAPLAGMAACGNGRADCPPVRSKSVPPGHRDRRSHQRRETRPLPGGHAPDGPVVAPEPNAPRF